MPEAGIAKQLADIQASLNEISAELALVKRQRQEMDDLKEDLTRVAKDMFSSAIDEFEDIAPFVKTGDFLHLIKLILRNTNNITDVILKLESVLDFFEDFKPIGKELFSDTLNKLDELDRAKYFEFAREAKRISDNVVHHFDVQDVRLLSDNIVPILETVRSLTQAETMNALKNAVTIFNNLDPDEIEELSLWKALKEMNDPQVKRGLGFLVAFLKRIANNQSLSVGG